MSGTQIESGYITDEYARNSGLVTNGIDSKDNVGMKIKNGVRMVNKGKIIFKGN